MKVAMYEGDNLSRGGRDFRRHLGTAGVVTIIFLVLLFGSALGAEAQ